MNRNELLKAVKDCAYIEGDFVTRAGKKTKYYVDKFQFETRPEVLEGVIEHLAQLLPPSESFTKLICPALGAVALAAPLAIAIDKPYVIIRKKEDNQPLEAAIAGVLSEGESVVVIEDVLTTGSTVIDVCELLEPLKLNVVSIISIIDREEGALEKLRELGYKAESLITTGDLKSVS
ncbi:orotate phosphoribosyltransferase [Candidatus Marinamargulisbacteria bacterium SCGC AAA071-K20]|nr:orotate phosphoribosyltransferase [Candidatus Marinamargulisbacteria bacterium SCGC AAA071-K20]